MIFREDMRHFKLTALVTAAAMIPAAFAAWIIYHRRNKSNSSQSQSQKNIAKLMVLDGDDDDHDAHSACCDGVSKDLKHHTQIFQKRVLRIGTSNVYVAIGYSLANCIMIEGADGIIIIDTTESPASAKEVLAEFRKITNKPVAGIVYTHFHHDHVGGSEAFIEEGNKQKSRQCPIWAHETTGERISNFAAVTGPIAYVRAVKMYGTLLERPSFENCGIGPFLAGADDDQGFQNGPTHTFRSHKCITIAGVELELIHAPGETDDQTVVYMPQHKILFAADNYYESFPNLYTIRGAPNRDVVRWASSIDTMIATEPDILVPSHTQPVYGASEIRIRLQNYRDAIQYVHDQTVRLMLKNYHPDEIAAAVELPSNLRDCEYLKQFYGTMGWSAKAIFNGYMGWFSGEECDLWKLTPKEYARRLVDLAGGAHTVFEKAAEAYDNGDLQWALELSAAILRLSGEGANAPGRKVTAAASALKTKCCVGLGQVQISANGRNWYMTSALINEEETNIRLPEKHQKKAILTMPFGTILNSMSVRFKPTESLVGVEKSMCFILKVDGADGSAEDGIEKERDNGWTLTIRNCVLYSKNMVERDADIVIETTEQALRQVLVQPSSVVSNGILRGNLSVKKGDIRTFLQFVGNLER